jgi:YHS domain-containing protein
LEKHNKKNKKQQKSLYKHLVDLDVDVESDAVKILDICDIDIPIKKEKPTKKENIVYELIEEKCDIVLDSNIKQNINVEKKEYIEVVVVEEEEEEVVVEEEEVVVEEEEVVIEEEEEEEEVVIEEEEEEVVVEEKEEEEEEVKYNAVKEVVEEEVVEEEVVEEEVVEVEEEVVEVEEEVVEVEEEVVEVEEEVEEEEEVYEVTIKGKTYYVMNEKNSIIYDIDENGDISIEVGAYKNGKPVFTKVNK